ncbi:MAG: crotonase/enoyl-CoA hydratase family protein [SAR324 cluster bacterium]|nr:crotonase/enoyl-CoA hydratase family protein [SAR324 cluster bacterium]MBF0353578.1 crotonase/enoyl-CoA hydratase family protein [SAR324 cluster bacterium]
MGILIEKANRVTTVIINRADVRNAVNRETAEALAKAFEEFDKDAGSDVAVLCGDGPSFCAGADLRAIAEGKLANRIESAGHAPMGPTRMLLSKPVIAAIEGYAVAGGLELALWCDLRIVSENCIMGVFCRRWGVPLIDGGTIRLPRLIGLSRAMDLILTGRPVDAQEALSIGLVHRIVPNGATRETAELIARQLTQFPQECMRQDRLSAYEQFNLDLPGALLNEFNHGLRSIQQDSFVEGPARFFNGQGRHGSFG